MAVRKTKMIRIADYSHNFLRRIARKERRPMGYVLDEIIDNYRKKREHYGN